MKKEIKILLAIGISIAISLSLLFNMGLALGFLVLFGLSMLINTNLEKSILIFALLFPFNNMLILKLGIISNMVRNIVETINMGRLNEI